MTSSEIRIPDVSDYQGSVNWAQVLASGRAGGICKATEGTSFAAKTFARNWKALGDLGAVRGAYHFARPGKAAPEAQADYFLSIVDTWTPTDLLVLDLEDGGGNLDAFALTFLIRIEQRTGIVPWFYSYAPFIRAHITDRSLARFPLWLAAYTSKAPAAPSPWPRWQLWQHTDKATIPGIVGSCDESVGTLSLPPMVQRPVDTRTEAVPVPPVNKEVIGVRVFHGMIGPVNLDSNGKGWVSIQAPLERILFVEERGSAPARDKGYWANVSHDVNDSGAETIVTLYGAPGEEVIVYYKILEEE